MDIHEFAERVTDLAERMADVADAAAGKRRRHPRAATQLLLLPAAGAGLYALAKSEFFGQQAKTIVDEAKTVASDLPSDLMNTVRQASPTPGSSTATRNSSTSAKRRTTRSGGQRRRQGSSASKRTTRS
jgi:hypothetical protein